MSRFYQALQQATPQAGEARLLQAIDGMKQEAAATAAEPPAEPQPVVEPPAEAKVLLELVPVQKPAPKDLGVDYRTVRANLPSGPLFPFDGAEPRIAEQYRLLRTNILQHPARPKVIAVSSATPGDGKTLTALNLAGILALKNDARVLLIDVDLRRRSLAETLGIPAQPGLADVLCGDASEESAIVRLEYPQNLAVLPSGDVDCNPAELLDSPQWKALLERLRARFSYVVLDTTPVAAVADYHLVEASADGVLLVLRPDHTRRAALQHALLTVPKAKLLGAVLNAVPDWFLNREKANPYYHAKRVYAG